ncbi:RIP metalloprotease RseP [Acidihalobacter prosperus]
MSVLWSLLAFIVAISILVTVHEFGHFWVARRMGVHVLRFSVGFGRPLWRRRAASGTEYVVAALPLGGYVKMLDEREGEVPAELADRAFNRKPVLRRMAIVAAGPIANFLLAVVLYAGMYMIGVQGIRPYIGSVTPGSVAAQAGLQKHDLILQVDGRAVQSWEQARMALLEDALARNTLDVRVRTADGAQLTRHLNVGGLQLLSESPDVLGRMGLSIWRPSVPVIAKAMSGGAAERAGLKAGDRIVAMNGEKIASVEAWIHAIQAQPGKPLKLTVERNGVSREVTVTPAARTVDGKVRGFIDAQIQGVVPAAFRDTLRTEVRYGPLEAFAQGAQRTWSMTVLTVRVLARLVVGQASVRNLSGPVTIAEYAGISAAIGLSAFLGFLGIVSVSLGVLNLLPVPVLDGGHLLYQFIELVRGRPLSESAQILGQKIGLTLLGALMALALYNDLYRLFN